MDAATISELVPAEAQAARDASPALSDQAVVLALRDMAERLASERKALLAENAFDVQAAVDVLDEGTLDRLRLDDARVDALARQLQIMAELPPLDRLIDSWTLDNGLQVTVRKIPIGVVGANFEARPGVALDIASQLLKSLNGCVLRTGAAALRTVTFLVDHVVRPALEAGGIPGGAVGLVRAREHDGAIALVSQPKLIPLVILRGSGTVTAALARQAGQQGVQVLAHAEGGGVLYVDKAADPEKSEALIRASLDRLGVCNRLNLLLVHRDAIDQLPRILRPLEALRIAAYGAERARQLVELEPLEQALGHEWANDRARVRSLTIEVVDSLEEACTLANTETSGLAAGIVTEDRAAAERFLDRYRGTAAYWHATTRFTDGFALMGIPESGINVGNAPGPRGPVTYRDLWLKQLRIVGDGSQHR